MPFRRPVVAARQFSTTFEREEPLGFVSCFIAYEIDGTVSPYAPSTLDSPAEGGDVEIEEVARLHPITGVSQALKEVEWPFTNDEMAEIEQDLAEISIQDSYDASDYDNCYDDFIDYDRESDDYIND